MGRSTAISWKIGLAVAALTLSSGQLRAQADEGLSEKLAAPPISSGPKEVPVILLPPASGDVFASRPPAPVEGVPIIMVQPARERPIAELISESEEIEPAEIEENATAIVKSPSVPEQPPRVALLPPATEAAVTTAPPPEPEKALKSAAPVVIPALPGRSPFRQAPPFKSEIVEIEPKDVAVLRQQQASESTPAKGNAATRLLDKLWPGDDEEASTSADGGEAPAALASASNEQAEADPNSEKPPIKRFLDGLQFWKN